MAKHVTTRIKISLLPKGSLALGLPCALESPPKLLSGRPQPYFSRSRARVLQRLAALGALA